MRQLTHESLKPPRQQTRNIKGHDRRHCWECHRRCLVCDSEVPGCKRCHKSGIHCPGYGDVKPTRLRWITPGRVISRDQKQKTTFSHKNQDNHAEVKTGSASNIAPIEIDMHMPIPRFEMNKEAHFMIQALEYCKWPPKPIIWE